MSFQLTTTLFLVGLASGYLLLRGMRLWRGAKKGCPRGCGCAGTAKKHDQDQDRILLLELKMRDK